MNTVEVDKSRLLTTLRTNRGQHRNIFDRAQIAYREAMVAELDRALDDAKNGRAIKRAFALPVPEDHTSEFDTAIEMVEWEVGDTVELDQHDFQSYVLNQWAWRASFAANTQSYLAT